MVYNIRKMIPDNMARNAYAKYLFLAIFLSYCGAACGYYCRGNFCNPDQYCCGDNLCCSNVYSLWYFWAGVLLVVVMLSSCWFFRYCYAVRPQIIVHQVTNYVPLPTEPSASNEMQHYIPCDDDDESLHEVILPTHSSGDMTVGEQDVNSTFSLQGPPPPYSKNPSNFGFGKKCSYRL